MNFYDNIDYIITHNIDNEGALIECIFNLYITQ